VCLGIPAKWSSFSTRTGTLPRSMSPGCAATINILLLEDEGIAPGDWVLIHVGFAMAKIDEAEAQEALETLRQMGQAYADEVQAVMESQIA